MNNKNIDRDREQLNALADGELNDSQREYLLGRLDNEPALRGEMCNIHRVKDLMQFAYPLDSKNKSSAPANRMNFGVMVASLLMVFTVGFFGGYLVFNQQSSVNSKPLALNLAQSAIDLSKIEKKTEKVIIYLGSSQKKKFTEALDKAELLLTKYKKEGTEVYVVTSAGGIDLLRASNTESRNRIRAMSSLYKRLNFVACNNQIYELHKKGQDVNLVKEAKIAPSAVQFVVDHLEKGWKYIAI